MTIYKVRLAGQGYMIHVISSTEPYLDTEGKLVWTPIKSTESDTILKIDWNSLHLVSYRESDSKIEKEKTVDLSSLKILTGKDNKKYVLYSDVQKLLK